MAIAAVAGTAGAVIGSEVGTGAVVVVGPGVAATSPGGAAVGGALGAAIGGYLLTAGTEIVNSVVNGDDESPSPTIAPPQGSNASNTEDNGNVGNKNKDQAPTAAAGGGAPPPDGNEPPDDHNNNDNKDNANSGNNSSADKNAGGIEGARQDLIDLIGPDATLGKNNIIDINGNGAQNETAQDVVDKIIGNREVEETKDLNPINGVSGSKAIHLEDGTVITYRPAGAASSSTDASTATVEVNNPALGNNKPIKMKIK